MLNELWEKVSKLAREANLFGISVPTIKDPKTGMGSVSLTLLFLSSALVILGLVGKWSGFLGMIDIENALEFSYASSALYFGRRWTSKTGNTMDDSITKSKE